MRPALLPIALIALLAAPPAGAAGRDDLPGAAGRDDRSLRSTSDDRNLWVLVPVDDGTVRILHHHPAPPGGMVSIQRSLSRAPEMLAAWDGRLWIVFPASDAGPAGERRREVFTLEARYLERLGGFLTLPPDQMGVDSPLPGDDVLVAFAGAPEGPVALLHGSDPRLLQLRGAGWEPLELPAGVGAADVAFVASPAPGGGGLTLLLRAPEIGRTIVCRSDPDGAWARHEIALDLDTVDAVRRVGNQVAVIRDLGSTLEIAYVRSTRVVPVGVVEKPAGTWAIPGLADALRLIERPAGLLPAKGTPTGPLLRIARIDPFTGAAGPLEAVPTAPTTIARMWHVSLLLAVAFTAVVAMIVIRPNGRGLRLPEPLVPLPLGARTGALVVDLAPGVAVALLATGVSPGEMVQSPTWLFSAHVDRAAPYLLMLLVSIGISTLTECVTGRSLGKYLLGAKIVTTDGQSPARWRLLIRGVLKLIVLLIPPLVLPTLLNPHLRGLPELLSGTVVAGQRDEESPDERDAD